MHLKFWDSYLKIPVYALNVQDNGSRYRMSTSGYKRRALRGNGGKARARVSARREKRLASKSRPTSRMPGRKIRNQVLKVDAPPYPGF